MKHFLLAVVMIGTAGCGGGGTTSGDDDPATGELLGTFSVELIAPRLENDGSTTPGYTAVLGKVYDGAVPDTVIWDATATSGDCTLSIPRVPFCSPACGANKACIGDDSCAAYPTAQSVGTVHLAGVKTSAGSAFDLTAVSNTYQAAGITLAYPAFTEGDAITLTASGSSFTPAFTAKASGVAELSLANESTLALASGTGMQLGWTAAGAATGSTVHVKLDISHHGGSKGKIECDTADSGSLTLASAMVDQLLGLGAAGYPTIIVTRSSTGHANAATGHVDLVVSSHVEAPISVPGVVSCTDDTQCTAPATCQDDLTCH
jgi:hypothetical protein